MMAEARDGPMPGSSSSWTADAVAAIEADDAVQAAVLTGAGGVFSAGADLREMADKGAVYKPWAGADGPLARPAANCCTPLWR